MIDPARIAAYEIMRGLAENDAYANLLLATTLREANLTGRDAAFATELTNGTLRYRRLYDTIIGSLSDGGLERIDPPVLDILRIGSHQALGMRVPGHAAVSSSVELTKKYFSRGASGFVNAMMRKVTARDRDTWIHMINEGRDEITALSIEYSHPKWIVKALRDALPDPVEIAALLDAQNQSPAVTLVARPGLCDPNELPGRPGAHSPWARILDEGGNPSDIPAVAQGRAAVQDEGSQAVTLLVADAPMEGRDTQWLDMCAGPGGKTALLAGLARGRGDHITANEFHPHRADLVAQNVKLFDNVTITVGDGRSIQAPEGGFDRVLVDAPCTGLGALRRRPEARWRKSPEDLAELTTLQTELLRSAIAVTRPGGIVGYATCSPHLGETRDIVASVTAEFGHVVCEEIRQWWPHRDGTDAMFCAVLRVG